MPKPTKLPRARVMWANHYKWADQPITVHGSRKKAGAIRGWPCLGNGSVLVLPMPSLKSARQRAKWENLSEGEKVERIVQTLQRALFENHNGSDGRENVAKAVLAVMEGRTL